MASTFWTRGSGKELRGDRDAQIVAVYLFSCPAGNMVGLFHLALPTLCHEIGIDVDAARGALERLAAKRVAYYDEAGEIVWLPAAPRIQIGADELHPNDKRVTGIRREVTPFEGHPFYRSFLRRWGAALQLCGLMEADASNPIEGVASSPATPSKGLIHQKGDPGGAGAGAGAGAGKEEVASPKAPPRVLEIQSGPPPAKPAKAKSEREPLPFRAAEALSAVKAAAGDRFAFSPDLLSKGHAISVEGLIRKRPEIARWALLGEWLASQANAWHEAAFDVGAVLAKPNMIDAALEWDEKRTGGRYVPPPTPKAPPPLTPEEEADSAAGRAKVASFLASLASQKAAT